MQAHCTATTKIRESLALLDSNNAQKVVLSVPKKPDFSVKDSRQTDSGSLIRQIRPRLQRVRQSEHVLFRLVSLVSKHVDQGETDPETARPGFYSGTACQPVSVPLRARGYPG